MGIMDAVGVASAAYGAHSSNKAQKQQQQAMDNQARSAQDNLNFQREQFGWQQGVYDEQSQMMADQTQFERDYFASQQNQQEIQRQMAQAQYDDWESTFGSIQDNMSNYYQAMDPKDFAAYSKQTVDQAYSDASDRLAKTLASRGIQGGGIEASARGLLEGDTAAQRAQLQFGAQQTHNQQQQQFLNSGMQNSQAQNNMLNANNPQFMGMAQTHMASPAGVNAAAGGVSNAYNNQGSMYGNQGNVYGNQAAQGMSDVAGGLAFASKYGDLGNMGNMFGGGPTTDDRMNWIK